VIFSEHFGENRVILLQTVAKWRCIKLKPSASFFLDHCAHKLCPTTTDPLQP